MRRLKGLNALRLLSIFILTALLTEVSDPSSSFIRVNSSHASNYSSLFFTPKTALPALDGGAYIVSTPDPVPMIHTGESSSTHCNTLGLPDHLSHVTFSISRLLYTQTCIRLVSSYHTIDHPPKAHLS